MLSPAWLTSKVHECRYGQQKQEGRLLVAKLDFLQALVVQAILSRASSWIPNTWHRFTNQVCFPVSPLSLSLFCRLSSLSSSNHSCL